PGPRVCATSSPDLLRQVRRRHLPGGTTQAGRSPRVKVNPARAGRQEITTSLQKKYAWSRWLACQIVKTTARPEWPAVALIFTSTPAVGVVDGVHCAAGVLPTVVTSSRSPQASGCVTGS